MISYDLLGPVIVMLFFLFEKLYLDFSNIYKYNIIQIYKIANSKYLRKISIYEHKFKREIENYLQNI